MPVRSRPLAKLLPLICGLATALLPFASVSAQGVPAGAQTAQTAQGIAGNPGAIQFRCPGATAVSATATNLQGAGAEPTTAATQPSTPALNPADAAERPCIFTDAGPEIEWSADHSALRMTAPGTWKDKLRTVLKDFDALHAQYVANPKIKDMGMWPARLQETFELAALLTYYSQRDDARYYAQALQDEYKAGIYDERPLLLMYGLQARERLGELAAPPAPVQPRVRR